MNVIVQSKTLEVTDALRAFCEKQAQKVNRFARRFSSVTIYIENIKRKKNDTRKKNEAEYEHIQYTYEQ